MKSILVRRATVFTGDPRALVLKDQAILVNMGRIVWVGTDWELDAERAKHVREEVDAGGALVTPGLIDCHTHVLFGGSRAQEFEMRLAGTPYLEILGKGGGIMSTVRATRETPDQVLLLETEKRIRDMIAHGVTTIEVKSGYGLSTEAELRMLRLVEMLEGFTRAALVPTFLGAHAIGPEFSDNRNGYVEEVITNMIPAVAKGRLAKSVDVFCEKGAFTLEETNRIFQASREAGLRVRVHAEQLSHTGSAALAAQHGALSADHLEYLKPGECETLAIAGTVAVLLPGAMITLGLPNPPVQALRDAGVPIAIATDCNPGTSMTTNLPLMMQLAASLWRLSPAECLAGATWHAAKALNMGERLGRIAPGYEADLVIWDAATPADIMYRLGTNPVRGVWKGGDYIS